MFRVNKLTAFLVVVFISTVAASLTTLRGANQDAANSSGRGISQDGARENFKERFPVVVYDAPEETDPDKRKKRKEKSKRYDGYSFVRKKSSTDIAETVFRPELWDENLEALPVKQSQKIVIGVVVSSEAHLSNDKSGVYTEFVVEVKEVLKTDGEIIAGGEKITVDRPGGVVRYPGGHKRLYRFSNMNVPAVGAEYLFFLTNPGQPQNHGVLTAYELTRQGVAPLDPDATSKTFQGVDRATFLGKVREAISASN